jgi:redox-sensitive bicupin YhaK (pirin superfamily)
MKNITGVYSTAQSHWVGDGFPVRSLFSYNNHGKALSPFLLLDYAGPAEFPPANGHHRGVGEHPHRGFETVTIVYKGEVAHRDSTGKGGVVGPGDVQWMTAAAGILHEEFHSEAFSRSGGVLEMVQLWVNLPAKDKMTPPKYQAILNRDIPAVALPKEAGTVRVIAGNYVGHVGPASTFSPLLIWDVRLRAGASAELPAPEAWNTALVVLHGTVQVNGGASARDGQLVVLDSSGAGLSIAATDDAVMLVLSGQPIHEPVAGRGPFVMNTQEEIAKAIEDFNRGQFGYAAH